MPTAPGSPAWLYPDVVVGPSMIAGQGLFAGVALLGGTPLATVPDNLTDDAGLGTLAADSFGRFVNHSCDPNLAWADGSKLVAVQDIAAGQELTLDYATSTADATFLLRCHCETYRCRQMVTGDDWQIPQLQARYAGRWLPAVQHRLPA